MSNAANRDAPPGSCPRNHASRGLERVFRREPCLEALLRALRIAPAGGPIDEGIGLALLAPGETIPEVRGVAVRRDEDVAGHVAEELEARFEVAQGRRIRCRAREPEAVGRDCRQAVGVDKIQTAAPL